MHQLLPPSVAYITTNLLMMYRQINFFCSENYTKQVLKKRNIFLMLKREVHRVIAVFVGAICHPTKFSLWMPVYDPRVEYVV